jgi:hypothetical protein
MPRLIAQTTIKGLLLSLFFLTLSCSKVDAFAGGDGSSSDPYVITTCEHLQDIYNYPSFSFVLGNDIDCSETATWNQDGEIYRGFNPIGGGSDFWGVLDGMYFTIRNLYIYRPDENSVGLFRTVEGGIVGSLNFDNANIVGSDKVGVVSGDAEGGEFYDIHVTNSTVVAEGSDEVGGLLGYGVETIMEGCDYNGTVTGVNRVGGLVGYEEVSITMSDCYNLGSVNGYIRVGGLIGSVEGTLNMTDSFNKGDIVSSPEETFGSYEGVGGLVGAVWQSTILRSYNEGDISTSGGELYVGGLIGGGGLVNIQQSYNIGNIEVASSSSGDYNGIGGILGSGINVTILDSYNWGDISQDLIYGVTEAPPIGGIVGFAFVSSIKNCYNQGVLTLENDSESPSSIGGLSGKLFFDDWLFSFIVTDYLSKDFLVRVGEYVFEFINNFNIGDIFGRSDSYVGGLIGSVIYNYSSFDDEFILSNNWWSNNVSKGIGRIFNDSISETVPANDEVEGLFEKESIVEGFKTYTHKVYDTDPDWDFAEVWSNVYEGRGYPVLGFHSILAPSKPTSNVQPGVLGAPFFLTLSSSGNTIRYTLDGSMPTCSTGSLYTSPVYISSSKTVKAISCDEYGLASVLGQFTYTISALSEDDVASPVIQKLLTTNTSTEGDVDDQDTKVDENIEDDISNEVEQNTLEEQEQVSDEISEERGFGWWWLIILFVVIVGSYIVYRKYTKED